MGLRFRKSISLGGGAKLNISKSSIGVSAGTKGARVSVNSKGRVTTSAGIPGTGMSYVSSKQIGGSERKSAGSEPPGTASPKPPKEPKKKWYTKTWFIILMLILFFPVGLYIMWRRSNWSTAAKSVMTALVAVFVFTNIFTPGLGTPDTPITKGPDDASSRIKVSASSSSSASNVNDRDPAASVSDAVTSDQSEDQSPVTPPPATPPQPAIAPEAVPPSSDAPAETPNATASEDTPAVPAMAVSSAVEEQIISEANKQESVQYVWATATGSKYHRIPNCGRTKNATEVTREEAEAMGLTPCSKCY